MVLIAPFVGAAVFLSGFARALPTGSSSSSYGSSDSSSSNYGSSNSGSSYGSSGSSSSNYGSGYGSSGSSSNYGSSGSNYGSSNQDTSSVNNQYTTSSTMMMDTSSTMMMDSTSTTMMMDTTSSTMNMDMTSTTTAMNTYQTSSYGSGSSYWGGSGYEDCVNQCIAQFGSPSSGGGGGSYQATATSGSYGSSGTGATHTVIVAPTKGLFRMVPFATNASVGDTIEFHWGADEHTVTKSSALTPCNKSTDAPVFASGEQNTSFVFTQVVNDTNPTFYYCGTPTHCEKGMFGVINPAMAVPGAPTSLGGMMSSMAANDSDLSAYAAYSSNITSSDNAASSWGANFDMSALPEWSHSLFATNVLFTRGVLAMNSEVLKSDNSIDLSSVSSTPLMLPMDLTPALNAATASPASAVAPAADAATSAAASTTASTSASASATPKKSGASSIASPRMFVGAVVVLATIFAL